MIGDIRTILLIQHIKVHNANALSSPYTIGFPAMTAWMGAVHALQRKLNMNTFDSLAFNSMAVISHDMDVQTFKGVGDYVNSIIGTGNPLDKDGSRSAFIEEPRCHLDATIAIVYTGISKDEEDQLLERISRHLNANMKIAGGDIMGFNPPVIHRIADGNEKDLRKLTRALMPGYAIIERRELMMDAMEQGQDAIDALLDYLVIHHSCEREEDGNVTWSSERKTAGWIVPIASGFHGISKLGQAKNQRDPETPHRFAESVVTLGEFKMPHSIKSLNEILWRYHVDEEKDLYLCQQSI
jgi:CRISPR-associated protein Csy2